MLIYLCKKMSKFSENLCQIINSTLNRRFILRSNDTTINDMKDNSSESWISKICQ